MLILIVTWSSFFVINAAACKWPTSSAARQGFETERLDEKSPQRDPAHCPSAQPHF